MLSTDLFRSNLFRSGISSLPVVFVQVFRENQMFAQDPGQGAFLQQYLFEALVPILK
jgi:hypothetical protein